MADIRDAIANGERFRAHAFELACAKAGIDHRLTKPNHPWTNGQVERMKRTIKEATVRRFYYDSHDQLRAHSPTSSTPTTSPSASRPSTGLRPTRQSAGYGPNGQIPSGSTQSITCRD
jgi:hypothetical protein